MNALRTLWIARLMAVLVATSVLMGTAGTFVDVAQQQPEEASERAQEGGETAASSPLAPLHVLRLTGAASAAQIVSSPRTSTHFTSVGVGVLAKSAAQLGVVTFWEHHRARTAPHFPVSLLRGIVWPMGP